MRDLRDEGAGIRRQQSETDLEQHAAIGGAIAHVSKLEAAVQAQGEALEGLKKGQTAQTDVLANVNTLVTTLTSTFTRHLVYVKVGLVIGGVIIGAVVAALKAL